eukprot:TRINITY_DN21282_c0_g4_i1.p1 TRINITY_DN21282_c0_g4~~TRINITY_DN21282_c0_g4_i1.p1  ORF type:complete len:240 (-),score=33.77 TRINITY_DN21282_c0_g4_i1:95-748(-)
MSAGKRKSKTSTVSKARKKLKAASGTRSTGRAQKIKAKVLKDKTSAVGASRWKTFTPAKVDRNRCLARTWASAQGGQCTRAPLRGALFCQCHSEGRWKVHGRVDGPIPLAKLLEFERHRAAANGERRGSRAASTAVAVAGGPRRVVQKKKLEQKLAKSADGSTTHTKTRRKERNVSCTKSGAQVERRSCVQQRSVLRTKAGRLVETDIMIVKRVRYR